MGRLPDNVKLALGIAAAVGLTIALVWEKSREKIISALSSLWDTIKPTLQKLAEWFKKAIAAAVGLVEASGPYAMATLMVAGKFYKNVTALTNELTRMSAAAA